MADVGTHMIMWAMSDRAIPRSLRMIEGFGVHTFRFVNKAGDSTFVKFHWKPRLGLQSTVWDEAVKLAGADPDFHRRDLWEAIDSGNFPEWDLAVQVFDQELADSLPYNLSFTPPTSSAGNVTTLIQSCPRDLQQHEWSQITLTQGVHELGCGAGGSTVCGVLMALVSAPVVMSSMRAAWMVWM